MRSLKLVRSIALVGAAGLALATGTVVCAAPADAARMQWNIPAQSLGGALGEFARQSKQQLLFQPSLVQGLRAGGIVGSYAPDEALRELLKGTGLKIRSTPSGAFLVTASLEPTKDGAELLPVAATQSASERQASIRDAGTTAVTNVAAASGSDGIEEIVVTATRREQRLLDVPTSITAETSQALRRRGATQLEDIVRNTPGLSNAGSGGGNRTNLTIRGVTSGTDSGLKQATVALLFDDIPVDPAGASIGTTNLRIVDVDRVEVLRGPQGTLFGSGSLSGAVRFVTNKPDLSNVAVSGELTGTTTRAGDESIWGNLVANVPLITDKLAVRVVGYGFDEGGWVDNVRTGERDVNSNQTLGGRLSFAARPTDRLNLTLAVMYQDSEDNGGGESLFSPAKPRVTNFRRSPEISGENTIVNLGARYDFDAVTFLSSSTYSRRNIETLDDAGYFVDLLGFALGVPGLTGSAPAVLFNKSDIYTQELRLSSPNTGALRWTGGLFYLRSEVNGGQTINALALKPVIGTDSLANISTDGLQEEIAAFGEATYKLGSFEVTAGARVSDTKVAYDTASFGFLTTGNPNPAFVVRSSLRQSETTVSPRFSLAYHPSSDINLYIQAARGYRVGGPNLTAGLGTGLPTSYDADHLWNYEVGAKTRLFDGRLQLNGALYYIDWSDIQAALSLNRISYTGNAGSAAIYGFELEAAAQATDWLQVGGSLSLSHGELTADVPTLTRVTGTVGVFDGERLPASPEVQVGAYAQASFNALGNDAFIRASTQYVGEQFTDFGKLGIRFGDYTVTDLRIGTSFGKVEVTAFLNNIFDSQGARGASAASNIGPLSIAPQLAFRVRPRTFGLTIRSGF